MIRECLYIPRLESERLILRKLSSDDVEDLREWLGLDVVYKFWGNGICTEALKCVVNFIYTQTQIDRLNAEADVLNIGSNRVLQKSAFLHEGCIRHGKMESRYCDYNIYGFIKDDYLCGGF